MIDVRDADATAPEMVTPRLINIRNAFGLTKAEFADRIGVDRSSYTKMEKAEKPVLPRVAFAIWKQFGADMNYIYLGRMDGLSENLSKKLIAARSNQQV